MYALLTKDTSDKGTVGVERYGNCYEYQELQKMRAYF